jgi:hypothetical protein
MTHPAHIRVQARCRHVADWLRRGCREAGGTGANDQGPWVMTTRLWILESSFACEGDEAAASRAGSVRAMRIRRALDAEAHHRGAERFDASPVIQLVSRSLDRSGRPPVGRVGRARSGDHLHPRASDPEGGQPRQVTCSVQCLRCPARRLLPSGSAPGEAPVPRATHPSWAGRCRRSPRWCSSPPCRRRVPEERLPEPGRVEGT